MSEKRWHRLEKGQSMMEYWPTIPAAIMIIISASIVVNFINGGFLRTQEALYRSSSGINYEQCDVTEEDVATVETPIGTHLIEFVGSVYDGENTTVTYRVTSSTSQAISHWILSIDPAVAANIVDSSEPWEWVDNDTSFEREEGEPEVVYGIKFDTEYEGGGKGKKLVNLNSRMANMVLFQVKTTTSTGFADGQTREITLVLSGEYDFSDQQVVTKSGNDGAFSVITAPTLIIDGGHTETTVKENCG